MCVCVCVCACVCACVCVCACLLAQDYLLVNMCKVIFSLVDVHMHSCMCAGMCVCVYVCLLAKKKYVYVKMSKHVFNVHA